MAVVGTSAAQENEVVLRGYEKNPMHKLAEQFSDIAQAGLSEQVDIFSEPGKFFMSNLLSNKMKNFFMQETYDVNDPDMTADAVNEHNSMLSALYDNDVKGLCEAAPLGAYNPVVGITFPMHKNLLMTTVFDKGAIPKDVAAGPQFTLTMETRTLYAPDGTEIDMFLEQNKIKDIVESAIPRKDIIMAVPEDQQTNVLKLLGAVNQTIANISRSTKVTKLVCPNVYCEAGDEYFDPVTKTVQVVTAGNEGNKAKVVAIEPIRFVSSYGQYDRTFQKRIDLVLPTNANGGTKQLIFQIAGSMHKNRFTFLCSVPDTEVSHLILSAALDVSSAAYETPKVKWSARTDFFEIPEAPHITVTISPEETRDIQAMYNINQLTKIMSMIKLTLVNYKDDKILENLDESFLNLPVQNKISSAFNFVPPDGFLGSHITWRYETFMDHLDTQVTNMLQILNDENMTVTIFGRPELIRKITPKQYTYSTPASIGPVMLDYKKTIVNTSDNRVYQFISSNKLRNDNNLILILCPRNSNRIIYKIFDYQLYVGNEIRDTVNYQLPAVTAFERFLFVQYQPVQGRIRIVNPSGLKEDIENNEPIGDRALNDYTANKHEYDFGGKWAPKEQLPGTTRSAILPASNAANEFKDVAPRNNQYVYAPNYAVDQPDNF